MKQTLRLYTATGEATYVGYQAIEVDPLNRRLVFWDFPACTGGGSETIIAAGLDGGPRFSITPNIDIHYGVTPRLRRIDRRRKLEPLWRKERQ